MSKNQYPHPTDEIFLTKYPYPIAVGYRRVIDAPDWRTKVENALQLFDYGLRIITLGVISQYLIRDADKVSDPTLNKLLLEKLPKATLGSWKEICFAALKAYGEKRDLFFMKELYDYYWDSSSSPHRPRSGTQAPYDRLIQIRNDLVHRPKPSTETAWHSLCEEVMSNLGEIMASFAFIQNYELVRITKRKDEDYDYVIYTGEHPLNASAAIHSEKDLQPGWFYLSKGSSEFLQLHPLLIFWTDPDASNLSAEASSDAALYDKFTKNSVTYIAMVLQHVIQDASLVGEFVRILYYNIEKVKQRTLEARRLTWTLLHDVAARIAEHRFGDVQSKFRIDLYLQRQEVKEAFDKFLASDKTVFLLLGKSGVGKSNFLISLANECRAQETICALSYNGAKLESDKPLNDTIARDLEAHLRLLGKTGETGVKDLLVELSNIENIAQHKVLLLIDAVNENADAKALLRRIEALVESSAYPWFKVVFTSRPEAWRTMKRGVKISEHRYYRLPGQEDLGIELQPFSIGMEMKPFTREELPLVYENYRRAYNLQTPYTEVPIALRRLLNDPLTLKLVAEINRNRQIPKAIRPGEIYEKYVEQLIREERLHSADMVFLEEDIMPLMLDSELYTNVTTAHQVNTTVTSSGRRLFELIHNDELLSNGLRVNQSFTNLVDAEILVMRGTPIDYQIGFKYERFYDHYAGKRLHRLAELQRDRQSFFLGLIEKTAEKPFLWGAVENALVQHIRVHGSENGARLCFTDQQRVKELMVGVLNKLGGEDLAQFEAILRSLIPPRVESSALQKAWQLIQKPQIVTDVRTRNSKKIAIEAASNMGVFLPLQTAALDTDPTIRTAAIRYIFHLWRRNPDRGFEVLGRLARDATRSFIPDLAAIESVFGLSLIILFDHHRDKLVLGKLQDIWREIIAKLLSVRENEGHLSKVLRDFIRERLFAAATTVAFRLIRELPQERGSNPDLEEFFRLDPAKRSLYRNIPQYLDLNGDYSKEEMERDFMSVLEIRDWVIEGVARPALSIHLIGAPVEFLPFLKKLFDEALKDPLPNPYVGGVIFALTSVLDRDPWENQGIFDLFVHALDIYQQYSKKHSQTPGVDPSWAYCVKEARFIGAYILYQGQRIGTIRTNWLEDRLGTALAENNVQFFEHLLGVELPFVAIEMRRPRLALEALALAFNTPSAEIHGMIQVFLSRLRVHYPDEVDDFLEEQQTSEEFRLVVRTNEPTETLGELIGIRTWPFFRDDVILGSPTLRALLIRILSKGNDSTSASEWVSYTIRELINLIYGKEVLYQTG